MFSTYHYVPILKGKKGEYDALQKLNEDIRDKLTPLIEIPQIPYDYENDDYAKTIDQHLNNVIETIKNSWGENRLFFLDLIQINADERMEDGTHPFIFLANEARNKNVKFIPVTGLERDRDYNEAVKNIFDIDRNGICLRIDGDYFLEDELESRISDLLNTLSVRTENCDLILDFKFISPSDEKILSFVLTNYLQNFPYFTSWRTFTISATSFPQDLSKVPSDSIQRIPRTEWHIWNKLIRSDLIRKPSFGDYAIQHPEPVEIDPRLMTMSANIRYTIENDWIIIKGHSVKRFPGFKQFHELSNILLRNENFKGRNFSWGDNYIYNCAQRTVSSGSARTWRMIGTNHHIVLTVNQISNLASSV